jgi:hypothetical protein
MTRLLGATLAAVLITSLVGPARADEQEAKKILDKAISALGGEEKLAKATIMSWKSKAKISFGGNENDFDGKTTVNGLDRLRSEFGNEMFQAVAVIAGDKGWRKFGDMSMEMDADSLANEKRNLYLTITPITIVPLKGKGFKVDSAGEDKVGDKPALAVKVTGPDGKDFTISFDKESGLPVKLVAKVIGFMGEEFTQESTYSDYKDFDGIKKATKVEVKRDGETFLKGETLDFKVLDKTDDDTFSEPK